MATVLLQVFERSPELTSRLLALVQADDTPREIVTKARGVLNTFPERELIATLNAHPRIGHDVRAISELSAQEQGTDQDPDTLAQLAQLNDEYERRFGFRFVVFVKGRSKAEIVPVMRERMRRTRESELRTGIEEFLAISLDRLKGSIEQDRVQRSTDDHSTRRAMDVDS
jgi:2-oxo-4-hydroxy-4-carboxy--5-ureidoimidazoline (OHCU) decarboxylase